MAAQMESEMRSIFLKHLGIDETTVELCPDCGAREMRVASETVCVKHTLGDDVVIEAKIPMWACGACGSVYTDGRGEAIEQEAIDRYLRDYKSN